MTVECKPKQIINDLPYKVNVVENQWITMSDGTKLSARIWYPEVEEGTKLPAILEYIPYRKNDGTRARDEPMHGYLSGHGYVDVRVDMRGTGESDGLCYDEYLKIEQDDALEVIDWISKQPWCDGNVGMMGKSWSGFNSLQVAARRPPALKAIIVLGFTDDRYNDDIHYKGGCLLNDNFWWGAIMLAYQSRPVDPKIVGDRWRDMWMQRLEEMPLWMATWMEHQTRDDYWKHGSVCEDYSDIEIPVFAIDGWADSYTNPCLTLMEGLNVPRKAIIGPWAHVYSHDGVPGPAMSYLDESLAWWDKWLKGKDTDALDCPMIQAWVEDSMRPNCRRPVSEGRWVGMKSWPTDEVEQTPLYLSDGKLKANPADKGEEVLLKTPLNHGLLAGEWMGAAVLGESPCDQRIDNGMSMVFDGGVLTEEFEILGFPYFEVELSSDKPNAMIYASICDVSPDGASERVSYGVMNLTHLQGHDKVVPLVPGEKVKAFIKLDVCGHRFAAGHKIRLSLATSFWPMFWVMPEDATLKLDLSTAKIMLPKFIGQDCKGPNMEPKCAALTPMTFLSQGHVDRSVSYDILKDAWTCITDGVGGVFGEGVYRFDDIDFTVEHNLKRELTLCNQDPLSAKYTIYQKMKVGREGWITDSDIVTTMSADKEYFYLTGFMDTKENDKAVFHKIYDRKIKRNGM